MKKLICILLIVLMMTALGCTAFAETGGIGVEAGQTMPDFTVSLTDGTSATLSELLKEKDLVVLNVFATWCKPCESEFPDMERVYQANSDRMVILSVSGDPDDTMEMIADYKDSHSLTFPMGMAGDALDFLNVTGFPTTVFITREGKVGFVKVGAFIIEGDFEGKVNTFLSADYNGATLPSEIATSLFPQFMALLLGGTLLLVIGRWRLFRKAGKPGWHSLIPVLNIYQEFELGWKGWFGILTLVCQYGSAAVFLLSSHANWTVICSALIVVAGFVLRLLESLKLAKAFGKGTGVGILLTLFQTLGRFGLGLSRAEYLGKEA